MSKQLSVPVKQPNVSKIEIEVKEIAQEMQSVSGSTYGYAASASDGDGGGDS